MTSPRDALNDLRWNRHALDEAEITFVHRGAPHDELTIRGADVREIGSWFFTHGDATIPYHRVLRIALRGETFWARKPPTDP